jgi:glutaredoxin
MNLIVYGRADGTCKGCSDLKKYLDEKGIEYDFRDIGSADVVKRIQYKKELKEHRANQIPFTISSGEKIIGFDKNVFDTLIDNVL